MLRQERKRKPDVRNQAARPHKVLPFDPRFMYSLARIAEIAHLAERRTRNAQVPGSIPGLGYLQFLG